MGYVKKNFMDFPNLEMWINSSVLCGTSISPNLEILKKNVWKIENTVIKIIERDKLNVGMFE